MGIFVHKAGKVYLAGYNISGDLNQMELTTEKDAKDLTVFGNNTAHTAPGLAKHAYSHQGLWQADASDFKIDDVLNAKFAALDEIMSICPTGGAAGEVAYSMKTLEASYAPAGKIGEIFAFSVTGKGTSDLLRATVMENGAKTTTAAGTARQLGAVAAGKSLYAVMHVIAVSGTNPTLDMIVASDNAEGFASGLTRATFAQATAIGAQWVATVGPITDDWWRPSWTVGGTGTPSFTVVVLLAIQ